MEELKRRIAVFDSAMSPFRSNQELTVPNLELALLQLRKSYELIAFAAISANRERYAAQRRRFEKDWKISDIVKKVERFNPKFLPFGMKQVMTDGTPANPHELTENGEKISSEELLNWHGKIGEHMHAANPYKSGPKYREMHLWACERRDHLVRLLSTHATVIEREKTFYLCSMNSEPEREVHVTIFNIVPSETPSHSPT